MTFFPTWIRIELIVCAIFAIWIKGILGLGLLVLGIFATSLYLLGTWKAIQMFSLLVTAEATKLLTFTTFSIILGFKIPFFIVLGIWLRKANIETQGCFIAGLVLVYSWVVGWAQMRAKTITENHGPE